MLANRKNARPAARKTSPTDATFSMNGKGIGMTSPSGPRWSRKLASRFASKTRWIDDSISAGVSPARVSAGRQTGMYPWFTTMTSAFASVPTKASVMPG